ncbi:F-box/FBD/LRR-repeat protein At1g13570-like [Syzygium oleosum]|uniref:F-box/FBD/LRR-repeat protein At1g13570-like n=1 Tax=Syzygium oleosum TaxID=219896 RepID=UPI0024B89128|nr:F-box/FBD/LRR-repeat protein At1g13570-like [Syzygium oleosum]
MQFIAEAKSRRACILSRKWRHKWSSIPRLVFDNQCTGSNVYGEPSQNLVKIIDRVLMLHSGPIETFVLSNVGFYTLRDIDHWILHLSKVSIKQITLSIHTWQKYHIPTFFFNCQDLILLKLYGCSANTPSSFEGFENLSTLYLQRVELSLNGLEALIFRCPRLKHLTLKDLEGITRVDIEAARNLESLDIGGAFLKVTFGVMNPLKSVTVRFNDNSENRHGPGNSNSNSSHLHKFFRDVHNIQILKIENYSLKYWALGDVPQTPPHALVHLKFLSICIDFNSKEQILTVMCLIRSSPQLKNENDHRSDHPKNQQMTMAKFWKDHHHSYCLEQVQLVSMRNIYGTEPEQEFMKFLLTSLQNLQTIIIRLRVGIVEGKLLRELLRFRRASVQAEVIFLSPISDDTWDL